MKTKELEIVSIPTLVIMITALIGFSMWWIIEFVRADQLQEFWYYIAVIPIVPTFLLLTKIAYKENGYISRKKMLKGIFLSCLPIANIIYILIEGFYLLVDIWTGSDWLTDSVIGNRPEPKKEEGNNDTN